MADGELPGLSDRLRMLRGGLSRVEFARRLGVPESTLRRYENGLARIPADFLCRVCREFHVSADWVLFGVEAPTSEIRRADVEARIENNRYVYVDGEKVRVVCVPVLNHVPAGFALEMLDPSPVGSGLHDVMWVVDPHDENAFGLTACGDSMHPVFPDGEPFLVVPRLRYDLDNDHAVVRIAGDGVCVKYIQHKSDRTLVISVNERYPTRLLPACDVEILGAARPLSSIMSDAGRTAARAS